MLRVWTKLLKGVDTLREAKSRLEADRDAAIFPPEMLPDIVFFRESIETYREMGLTDEADALEADLDRIRQGAFNIKLKEHEDVERLRQAQIDNLEISTLNGGMDLQNKHRIEQRRLAMERLAHQMTEGLAEHFIPDTVHLT
jgi:hypothetical protein